MSTPYSSSAGILLGKDCNLLDTDNDGDSPTTSGDFQALVDVVTDQLNAGSLEEFLDEQPLKKQRTYKKRKSTHAVRREEKMALETEINALMTKLNVLQVRKLMQRGEADPSLSKQLDHNAALRDAVQEHHLMVARIHAMMENSVQRHSYSVRPTETYIHLVADPFRRHETLSALRRPKLDCASQFIRHRSLGLHPTADYFNEERYETSEGDFCNVRFDRTSLRGVRGGVQAVFQGLKHAIFNAEIVLSEAFGNITIREDDEMEDTGNFSQMRLVVQSTTGILVENNLVHFSDFVQTDENGNSFAIATTDFVDKDDRFPYRPHERIRRDAMAIILVTPHSNTTANNGDLGEYNGRTFSDEESNLVVVTRWTFARIYRTELNIPPEVIRSMRDSSGQISETILNCVRETVGLPKTS
ncbi:hypothetical protein PHMEG_00017635 [Phytophthora megakarya]|uniref:Uncharacterized protein n=1 Tax=Phytophthora megakarya TaxID=4795 RepID=A0A225VVT5_9STRA|nr:hypothetical protein PHMEG_00017635 [Phytophthora megakarya]